MEQQSLSVMEIGRMMHEIFRVFKKRTELQQQEEIKISPEQFSLLHALSEKEDEVIQKDMAEIMGKDKSAILRMIDSLEEKGLVRRVAALDDRRKNYLMVTKVGNRVISQYMNVFFEMVAEILQGLTPAEIDTFHKVVNHLKSNAEKL
jgi:MarR family transcriptional regulator for hemolysin